MEAIFAHRQEEESLGMRFEVLNITKGRICLHCETLSAFYLYGNTGGSGGNGNGPFTGIFY